MDFEDCLCVICGSAESVPADGITWRETPLNYVICSGCGLKYMKPRITQEWYHRFYEAEFWQEKIEHKGFTYGSKRPISADEGLQERLNKQRWRASRILALLAPFVRRPEPAILDCGAAFGVACQEFSTQWGARAFAVEPSLVSREVGEQQLGVHYVARYVEELPSVTEQLPQLDAVILSHVLENVVEPLAALRMLSTMMHPQGVLYIDTCNFFYNNAINPYHPYVFSPETLEDLLSVAGFQVVFRQHDPRPSQTQAGGDPYCVLISKIGPSSYRRSAVDVQELMAEQAKGLQMRERQALEKKTQKLASRKSRLSGKTKQ